MYSHLFIACTSHNIVCCDYRFHLANNNYMYNNNIVKLSIEFRLKHWAVTKKINHHNYVWWISPTNPSNFTLRGGTIVVIVIMFAPSRVHVYAT